LRGVLVDGEGLRGVLEGEKDIGDEVVVVVGGGGKEGRGEIDFVN